MHDGDLGAQVDARALDGRDVVVRPASEVDGLRLDGAVARALQPDAGRHKAFADELAACGHGLVAEVGERLLVHVVEVEPAELVEEPRARPGLAGRPGKAVPERDDLVEEARQGIAVDSRSASSGTG